MSKIVSIAETTISAETADELETDLKEANEGDLVGLALVKLYKGFRYEVKVVGEARNIPTFTRGAVDVLDDDLAELIRIKRDEP